MIEGLGNAGGRGGAVAASGTGEMGKEEFLKLLTTQLQQQDPLNPQDGTQFVTQLAQFTTLERLVNIEQSMMNVAGASMVTNATLAADFIDATVRAKGDSFSFEGTPEKLHFELGGEAPKVTVEVVDAKGEVVKTIDTEGTAGSNTVTWDGTNQDGSIAKAGTYTFRVSAEDADGGDVSVNTSIEATVLSVSFKGGVPHLVLDNGTTVPLGDALEVLSKKGQSPVTASGADGDAADTKPTDGAGDNPVPAGTPTPEAPAPVPGPDPKSEQ